MLEFRKFSEFPRGTLYDILQDAYSYDSRNKELCLYYEIIEEQLMLMKESYHSRRI